MTVVDLEKLETSPPKINPRRKNMKIVSNKAMTMFGPEAFNIRNDDFDNKVARLTQTKNLMPTSLTKAQSISTFPVCEKELTPK